MMSNQRKALVVFSGGQDSTTMLYWAKREFAEVQCLCFNYGQQHALEVEVAQALAADAGVKIKVMDVSFIASLASSSLTDSEVNMDESMPNQGLPNTFVP